MALDPGFKVLVIFIILLTSGFLSSLKLIVKSLSKGLLNEWLISDSGIFSDELNQHDNFFSLGKFFKHSIIVYSYTFHNFKISKLVNCENISIVDMSIVIQDPIYISLIFSGFFIA